VARNIEVAVNIDEKCRLGFVTLNVQQRRRRVSLRALSQQICAFVMETIPFHGKGVFEEFKRSPDWEYDSFTGIPSETRLCINNGHQ